MGKRAKTPQQVTSYPRVDPASRRPDTPERDDREQAERVLQTHEAHLRRSKAAPPPGRSAGTVATRTSLTGAVAMFIVRSNLNGPLVAEAVNIVMPTAKRSAKRRPGTESVLAILDTAARLPIDLVLHGSRRVARGRDSFRQMPLPLAGVDATVQQLFRRVAGQSPQPSARVSAQIVRSQPPLAVARSASSAEPLGDGFIQAERSRGQVVAVSPDGAVFTADIEELDAAGAWLRVDLPLKEIDPGDMDLVRPGATFDIAIGTPASPVAFKTRFNRLKTTPESVIAGQKLAATLPQRFDVSGLRTGTPASASMRADSSRTHRADNSGGRAV